MGGDYPKWVKAILFAPGAAARAVAEALHEPLAAAGWKPELAPDGAYAGGAESAARETAAALVGCERLLDERRPEAAVLIGDGNPVLAAAIAAQRIELPIATVPVARGSSDGEESERNHHLIGLLADLTVNDHDVSSIAAALSAWPATARRDAPGHAGGS